MISTIDKSLNGAAARRPPAGGAAALEPALSVRSLSVYYGESRALKDVSLDIPERAITAFIGPSGCGKSTLLRSMNRMNDVIPGARVEGEVLLRGENIYGRGVDVTAVRRRIGMVFQRPNPFPFSIRENVAYGPRLAGVKRGELDAVVEASLRKAALWDEVKDRLKASALQLSGGQQQRLCIARALAVRPEVLLLDEPCSALDPIATARIEELLLELRAELTVVIVTHNMQQAARIADRVGYFLSGELIEYDDAGTLFARPSRRETADYVSGRLG